MRTLLLAALLFTLPIGDVLAEPGTAPFNPALGAAKVEVKELLAKPALSEEEQKARDKTFGNMIALYTAMNEPHPHGRNDPFFPPIHVGPRVEPSVIAGPTAALVFLAVGAAGWVGLSIGAFFLERRAESHG